MGKPSIAIKWGLNDVNRGTYVSVAQTRVLRVSSRCLVFIACSTARTKHWTMATCHWKVSDKKVTQCADNYCFYIAV